MTKIGKREKKKIEISISESTKEAMDAFGGDFKAIYTKDRYNGWYKQLKGLFDEKKMSIEQFLKYMEERGDKIEFDFPIFKDATDRLKQEKKELSNISDIRGVKCISCGSTRTTSASGQFRSLDEGATTKFFCDVCYGKRYKLGNL